MADSEEPKIIVDEDWKSQVQAEKERLDKEAAGSEREQAAAGAAEAAELSAAEDDPQLPPPSFAMLVSSMAAQAMVALGQLPDPVSGEAGVRPNLARYSIDTLEMLEKKTRGNLDDAEQRMLEDILHQLRMAFVAVKQ